MRDLGGEELEEAVELVGVAAHRRGEAGGVGVRRGLDRAHVELEPVAVALDAAEHPDGVALGEPRVEQVDVVPDASLDAPARVDELEREVRSAALRAQPPLARDRVDALDDAVLGQLGDACSRRESRPESGCYGPARWPTSSRSARSATTSAWPGRSTSLVAPPYDVISAEEREALPRP